MKTAEDVLKNYIQDDVLPTHRMILDVNEVLHLMEEYALQFKTPVVSDEEINRAAIYDYNSVPYSSYEHAFVNGVKWMRDKLLIILSLLLLASCATTKPDFLPEDQMFITRKYIGDVVRCSEPSRVNGNYITEIKINTGDLLQVYCRKCKFTTGDRLYVRIEDLGDTFANSLVYVVESRSGTYRISQMEYGDKLLVQESF